MKKTMFTSFIIAMIVIIAGCSSDESSVEHGEYNPSDYDITLIDTDGAPINVFNPNDKELYLYFTGVT